MRASPFSAVGRLGSVNHFNARAGATRPFIEIVGVLLLKMVFDIDKPVPGSGGKVTLWANDQKIGEGTMPNSVAMLYTTCAAMDIGRDNGGVVDLAHEMKAPYAFTGNVRQVVFELR